MSSSLLLLKSMLMESERTKSKEKKKKLQQKPIKPKVINKPCTGVNLNMRCRICDKEEDGVIIPIFNNYLQPNLSEEIYNFSGIRVENSDGWSKWMCQKCLDLLNGCISFREMCQKTSKKIIEISIKKENNVESTADSTTPTPKKKFLCDICGYTSKRRANLQIHKATHENVFPYKCEICPYRGRTVGVLRVHNMSHLSEAERPYRCPHCPRSSTSASNLAKHIRQIHTVNETYKCTDCGKAFKFERDLQRHIKEVHLRQCTVQCEICFKKYNTKQILREHQYKIHKMKFERQGRVPAYLKAQLNGLSGNSSDNNMNDNIDIKPIVINVPMAMNEPMEMNDPMAMNEQMEMNDPMAMNEQMEMNEPITKIEPYGSSKVCSNSE